MRHLILVASLLIAARGLAAQQAEQPTRPCTIVLDTAERLHQGGVIGERFAYVGGRVVAHCDNEPTTISSDSLAYTESNHVAIFVTHVKYRDSTGILDSDKATYYQRTQRLYAEGHVYSRNLSTGTEMRGPNLDLLRVAPPVRDTQELTATGRPTIRFHPAGDTSSADSSKPFIIIGDRVHMRHTDRMWASGHVVITRPDMDARSDSAQLRLNDSVGYLIGQPLVAGRDTAKIRTHSGNPDVPIDTSGADSSILYRLTGHRIRFNLGEHQQIHRVLSSGDADARGPDWHLTSDTLDMTVDSGQIQRTEAWGKNDRAFAYSGLNTITADSLDIQMPAQVMKQVWAYGHSRATSKPDSLVAEDDWLSGDSLIAMFVPIDTGAAKKKSQIDHVIAFGTARAYYHTANQRDSLGERGINYSRGDKINIAMQQGKVHTVDIVGKVDGVYLEPIPPKLDTATVDSAGNPIPRDSLGRRILSDSAKTLVVPNDTSRLRPAADTMPSRPPASPAPAPAPPSAPQPVPATPTPAPAPRPGSKARRQ
ncbi:MAG TPA: hypothetical protein VGI92_07580 [Gemmatimonadales bacterium]|jgi:lipopolysaccharide export system protein LptA